ncbi:L-galactose dehydrogenase [Abditibacterium utsteinense]|uniref:L-galactose dehydrogenase n=1 Tax=Abditibacterium utsteinense TaxID=1960156 RepID=A0A2S8SSI6_9BACT|nr:aldo/keto reductase [Abditibacterium utsteinense]PQV63761.1 L-galactose dehydrogenase [Abditibacterium utsteinense]
MQNRTLGKTGLQVSVLGYGASPLGGVFGEVNQGEGMRCVHRALDLGINFIDVSPYYGLTKAETVLGKALKTVSRERYILATKVGRYAENEFDFSAARVTKSVDESLSRLGVDCVDLIQCHDIEFGDLNQIVEETLPALQKIVAAGKARFIGVTGLPLRVFEVVNARAEIDTILSYCRFCLQDESLLSIAPLLEEKNVGIINASPLSMGLLTPQGPPDWHPAPPEVKAACARAAAHCAQKGRDIAQLALQWALVEPRVATTLVGTSRVENIEKNVRWAQEPLDEELLAEVRAILAPVQGQTWPSGRPENNDLEFRNSTKNEVAP